MTALDIASYIEGIALEEAGSTSPVTWALDGYVGHLSPSSISMALRCLYQWQQRYIRGRKERPGESPVIGTAVHAALERNFEQKIESHEDLPTVELVTWFDDVGFPTVVQLEQAKNESEVLWDTDPDRARSRGRAMLSTYRDSVAPRIQPISTEGSFTTEAFDLPVPMVGRFDVVRETSVIDIKTGKRSQSTPKPDWKIQAGIYAEAEGKPVEFHSVSATEKNAVTLVTPLESEALLVHPSFAQRAQMKQTLRAVASALGLYMEMFGPDEDWPTNGVFHPWACSYCGFRQTCPAWVVE